MWYVDLQIFFKITYYIQGHRFFSKFRKNAENPIYGLCNRTKKKKRKHSILTPQQIIIEECYKFRMIENKAHF